MNDFESAFNDANTKTTTAATAAAAAAAAPLNKAISIYLISNPCLFGRTWLDRLLLKGMYIKFIRMISRIITHTLVLLYQQWVTIVARSVEKGEARDRKKKTFAVVIFIIKIQ